MKICSKKMKISDDFKNKLETTIGVRNTEYTYIPGQLIQFKGTNMCCVNPNKIVIKKSEKEVLVLYYGEYYHDEDAIFLYDIQHRCSWNKLKELMA